MPVSRKFLSPFKSPLPAAAGGTLRGSGEDGGTPRPVRGRLSPAPLLLALAAVGSATALAVQFYRRPAEMVTGMARAAMLLAGAREGTCDGEGFPIHYYCAGRRGEPIVLIHGLGGSAENWARLLPRLSKEYMVYALDLPGFGQTPLAPEGMDISTHVQYVKRFIDALGYPQVSLVGNSLGGWIATSFAVKYPESVKRLYLLNSAGLHRKGSRSPYAPDREAARRSIQHLWTSRIPVPGFVLDAMIRQSQRPAYAGFIKTYDWHQELDGVLSDVQAPTTIIWGTRDRLLPRTCADDFHNGIPNSRLFLLPKAGHTPQMGAVGEVARIILADAHAN